MYAIIIVNGYRVIYRPLWVNQIELESIQHTDTGFNGMKFVDEGVDCTKMTGNQFAELLGQLLIG